MSIWKENSELNDELLKIIESGNFKDFENFEELQQDLKEKTGIEVPITNLKVKVGQYIWHLSDKAEENKATLETIKFRVKISDSEIEDRFPDLPVWFVRRKLERESRSSSDQEAPERAFSFADASDLEKELDLPSTTLENPFTIPVKEQENPKIEILNSIQVGLIYPKNIERNVARNEIKLAEARDADAILVTGNLIWLDTKRTTPNKVVRDWLSGMHVKPEILSESFAYDSEEDIEEYLKNDEPVFIPMKERFHTLIDGVRKLFHEKNEKTPIFSNNIFIQLGLNEDKIINRAAYEELRARVQEVKNRINQRIRELKDKLEDIKSPGSDAEQKLIDRIRVLEKREKNVNMYQANPEFLKHLREVYAAWMVDNLEKAIPNSKVIGIGKSYVRLGKEGPVVRSSIVDHQRTSDTSHGYEVEDARKRSGNAPLADAIIVNGNTPVVEHSTPINYRDINGNSRVSFVIQSPVLLDRDFLKRQSEDLVQGNEPVQRLLGKESLYTGALGLEFHRVGETWLLKNWHTDSKFLSNPENFTERIAQIQDPEAPTIMYTARQGDDHEGHPSVLEYETNEFPYRMRHDEAFIRMLNEMDAPIMLFADLGDTVQGRHFDNQNAPRHKNYLRQHRFKNKMKEIYQDSDLGPEEKAKKLYLAAWDQDRVRGEIRPQDQRENYLERFVRNQEFLKFLVRLIKRSKECGIITAGDVSLINIVPGDHMTKTHDGEVLASIEIKRELENALVEYCLKNDIDLDRDDIKESVEDLNIGEHGAGYGAIGVMRRGYSSKEESLVYSLSMKHKQEAAASKFRGTTRRAAEYRDRRGAHMAWQQGLFSIAFRGDAHMGGDSLTNYGFLLATGCQTEPDAFGEWFSYPNSHISSDILGMPIEGRDKGSFVTMSITRPVMQEWLKNPNSLDPEKVFRNALGK